MSENHRKQRTIIVGVCGGIAAYKVVDVVNELTKEGHTVHVIMTQNATQFVTPLTFQTLSHQKVVVDQFDPIEKWDTEHISLAKKADLFVVAPATANIIGKMAHGLADDMLTTTLLATRAPKVIFPAMNTAMWENPIVQDNVDRLRRFGYRVEGTDDGYLACGDTGSGKLLPVATILEHIRAMLQTDNQDSLA